MTTTTDADALLASLKSKHDRIVYLEQALAKCQQVLHDHSKAMIEVIHGRPKPL